MLPSVPLTVSVAALPAVPTVKLPVPVVEILPEVVILSPALEGCSVVPVLFQKPMLPVEAQVLNWPAFEQSAVVPLVPKMPTLSDPATEEAPVPLIVSVPAAMVFPLSSTLSLLLLFTSKLMRFPVKPDPALITRLPAYARVEPLSLRLESVILLLPLKTAI